MTLIGKFLTWMNSVCSRLKDTERTKQPCAVWFCQWKVQVVTCAFWLIGSKPEVPTTLSLGLINLWEQSTEFIETFPSIYQFIIQGLKEFRTGLPEMYHYGMCIPLSWRQSRRWGLKRNFSLSLEELKLEALPIIRAITRNKLLWHISVWQGEYLITEQLLFLSSREWPSSPRKPVPSHSLAQ